MIEDLQNLSCLRELSKTKYKLQNSLFCVPGVFGSPYYFRQLSRQLGLEQSFYSWQQAKLLQDSSSLLTVESIATEYIASLKKIQAQGPYYLAGHSFGGLVAFEMSRQLQASKDEIALVAVIDTVAPVSFQKDKLAKFINHASDFDYLELMREMLKDVFGEMVQLYPENNSRSSTATFEHQLEQMKDIFEVLHAGETIAPKRTFSTFKSNWRAMLYYNPLKTSQIPLMLCSAAERSQGKLIFDEQVLKDSTYGWSQLTDCVEVYQIPGNHSTMLSLPHVQILAARLATRLNQPASV